MQHIPALAGALCVILSGAGAAAFDLSPQSDGPCLGQARCRIGEATLSAGPDGALLARQMDEARGAMAGLGVAHDPGNGFNDPELQGPVGGEGGESVTVAFDTPHIITSITLVHLFNPQTVPGDAEEEALIEGFAAGRSLGILSVASLNDASLRLNGPAGALVQLSREAGAVTLANPFDGAPLDRLVFRAGAVAAGDSADYSIARIAAQPAQ